MDDQLKKLARYLQPFFLEAPPEVDTGSLQGWGELLRLVNRFRGMTNAEAAQLATSWEEWALLLRPWRRAVGALELIFALTQRWRGSIRKMVLYVEFRWKTVPNFVRGACCLMPILNARCLA